MKKRQTIILTDEQIRYINTLPFSYRQVTRKAMEGTSLRAAIKAKCLDCCCWQRAEIADCRVPNCALYPYRPYKVSRSRVTKAVL